MKDHYNRLHLICKYLGSFTILDNIYEPDDTEVSDTSLETLQDLAHYTRSIPFYQNEYNDIWYSCDFFL